MNLVGCRLHQEDKHQARKCAPSDEMWLRILIASPPPRPDQRRRHQKLIQRHWNEAHIAPKAGDLAQRDQAGKAKGKPV